MKKATIFLTVIVIVILAAATVVEGTEGTPFVHRYIYGSWWFLAMWAAFAATGTALIIKKKLYRRKSVFLIHLSFIVILLGALLSWLTAESGSMHLRLGEATSRMKTADGKSADIGFKVALKTFRMECYPGTDAPMDYVTEIATSDDLIEISMNHIGYCRGYRFMQSGYDSDMRGSVLGVYHDPWGIGVTYCGYALLLVSLILMLAGRGTRMRQLYRKAVGKPAVKAALLLLIALSPLFSANMEAQERVNIDSRVAHDFSKVCVLYQSRITPVGTVARQFVVKLSGKDSWDGLSADEVFAGWVFDIPYWETVRMIEVKDRKAQELLGLKDKWASFSDFWNQYNEYKLEKPLREAAQRGDTQLQKHLREADEKFNIVRMLYGGEMLKMFPYNESNGKIRWFSPGEPLTGVKLYGGEMAFIRKSMDLLAESIVTGDNARAESLAKKIYAYQHIKANAVIPSKFKIYSELFYNGLNACHWLTMLWLALSLAVAILCISRSRSLGGRLDLAARLLAWLMLLHTSVLLLLRWLVSGHLPLSNGYETMQFLAWAALLLTLALYRRLEPVKAFGPLLAAFALLVALITDKNPQITQLMPVLQSPLLSVHVMVIMFSYALFGLMALVSAEGIVSSRRGDAERSEQLAAMSLFLLYPAVSLLAAGIFIGAVWANVSWGRYWSWDSKETWALITLLVYSAPLHPGLKWLRRPLHVHIYLLLAFLSVLFTYFGVNYLLTGMHSYA